MAAYRVRPATAEDAAAICRIYNQGIEDRLATLETEWRTADERRQWLSARSQRHPVIVCEPAIENRGLAMPASTSNRPPTPLPDHAAPATTIPTSARLIAWGSLNVFNARDAYRFVADISVYVERQWRGKGAGRVILERLIELGREHGFHKLVLSAFPFNPGGMALYEKTGFRTVGIYKEQGQLDGRWVDTIVMERLL
jgi:L-amino acid N-acyltransferase YncA